jgi:hypothetical protein
MTGVLLKLVQPITKLDIECEKVLQSALDIGMGTVLLLGYDKDGEFYAAASTADGGEVVYLCELFKHKLLSGEFLK